MAEILFFSIYTFIRLIWDTIHIRTAKQSISRKGYNIRDLVAIPLILLIAYTSTLIWPSPPFWTRVVAQLGIMVMFFDYAINLTTGKKLFYISLTSKNIWERARLACKTPYAELVIKIWLLTCAMACYFYWELL
jgi:hypothetical protein